MPRPDRPYKYNSSFRSLAAIILLFSFLVGPFAISAQCDHLFGAERGSVKLLDYDVVDTIIQSCFHVELKTTYSFQMLAPPQIQLSCGSQPVKLRSGRAPPVTLI